MGVVVGGCQNKDAPQKKTPQSVVQARASRRLRIWVQMPRAQILAFLNFYSLTMGGGRIAICAGRVPVDKPHDAPEGQSHSPELKSNRESQVRVVEDYVEESQRRKEQTAKPPRKASAKRQDGYPKSGNHIAQDPTDDAKDFQLGHQHRRDSVIQVSVMDQGFQGGYFTRC